MAIVGEPCNADAHAKIPALFMSMLCPPLCVHMYCTHWLWVYSCLSSLTDRSIASIRGHHTDTHTPHTHRVKCWAQVPRLKNLSKFWISSISTLLKNEKECSLIIGMGLKRSENIYSVPKPMYITVLLEFILEFVNNMAADLSRVRSRKFSVRNCWSFSNLQFFLSNSVIRSCIHFSKEITTTYQENNNKNHPLNL